MNEEIKSIFLKLKNKDITIEEAEELILNIFSLIDNIFKGCKPLNDELLEHLEKYMNESAISIPTLKNRL
jgi:hypothetical protein